MICVFLTKIRKLLLLKVLGKMIKDFLLSCCCRPPNCGLSGFLQNKIKEKFVLEKKISYIIGDFNMNCLKYHKNTKTRQFYNNIFEKGAIPIINCPTQISEHSAGLIDNILTTDIFSNSLRRGFFLQYFVPIFFSIQLMKEKLQEGVAKIKKECLITATKLLSTSLETY